MPAKNKTEQDEKVALYRIHRIDDEIRSGAFPNAESFSKKLEVSFTTTQLPEVQRRVLGQGHTVRVLEPPELIEAVKKEAAEIRGMY